MVSNDASSRGLPGDVRSLVEWLVASLSAMADSREMLDGTRASG